MWPGVPAGDKMGGALAGDREGFGGDFGVPRGVLREIWEGPREIWGVPRMFRVIQRNLGLSQGVQGGSAGVQGTVWGPRGCSGGPEGFWGFPRGFRVSQWVSGDPREHSRAPQEGLEKVPGRWESQWGPQGFGGPLELEEPQEVLVGSPGVLGVPGGPVSPSPPAQRQAWVRGGGRAWCRSRTCCTSCSRDSPGGAPPFPQPHFTPWTAGEGGKIPQEGRCAVHSLSSPPKRATHTPRPTSSCGKGRAKLLKNGVWGVLPNSPKTASHCPGPTSSHRKGEAKSHRKEVLGASSPSTPPLSCGP